MNNQLLPPGLISVIAFAEDNGLLKPHVFKVLKRLNIQRSKSRGGAQNGNQLIDYITQEDARRVLEDIALSRSTKNRKDGEKADCTDADLFDVGVFYLLRLEPELDPGRFKVGFSSSLNERVRVHRSTAYQTQMVATWPCCRLWEKTVIECVTDGCERLHTEVFRAQSLEAIKAKCDQFFALMPAPRKKTQG